MKAKLFTHTDLDGVVSNILMCHYANHLGLSYSTEMCSYDNVDKEIMGYINGYEYNPDDLIIITDICPSIKVIEKLESLPNKKILLDHHQSAEEAIKDHDYEWLIVNEGDSGAMISYKYLNGKSEEFDKILKNYQYLVLVTDLWDSKSRVSEAYLKYKKEIYNTLALFSALGFNKFKERFLRNPSIKFTEYEQGAVDAVERIKKATCKGTYLYKFNTDCEGSNLTYGLCFVGRFRSEIAEYQFLSNLELNFLFLIDLNSSSGSLRRRDESLIDLAHLAEQFEGGGHPYASGFIYDIGNYHKIINRIVTKDFKLKREN